MEPCGKVSSVSLFLELGVVNLNYVIMARRLNFLHYILSRPDDELVKQFFDVQVKYPVKNDWVLSVKSDLKTLNINLTFDEIKKETKDYFSKLVKAKVRSGAFEDFMKVKRVQSKMSNLNYEKLELQSYFKTNNISVKTARSIFAYRTRTSQCKVNFRTQYINNLECPVPGCKEEDSQQHLLDHSTRDNVESSSYTKLFSANPGDNLEIIKLLEEAMSERVLYVGND